MYLKLSRINIIIFLIFIGILLALGLGVTLYFLVYNSKWNDFKNAFIIICSSLFSYIIAVPIIGYLVIPIISIIYNIRSDLKRKSFLSEIKKLKKELKYYEKIKDKSITSLTEERNLVGEKLVEKLGDNTEQYENFNIITRKYKTLLYKNDFSNYIISPSEYKNFLSMLKYDIFRSDKKFKFFYIKIKNILFIFKVISEINKLTQKILIDMQKINDKIKKLEPLPE